MGELARRPGCPEPALTPLELLTPRPGEGFTIGQKLAWPLVGTILGLGTATLHNFMLRRPLWAGLPLYVFYGGAGYLISTTVRDMRFTAKAEDDAILRHYVTLHPEDFPPFERRRWRDVYEPFQPVR